jgi:hypothetical protein
MRYKILVLRPGGWVPSAASGFQVQRVGSECSEWKKHVSVSIDLDPSLHLEPTGLTSLLNLLIAHSPKGGR